jgi:FecR protein
VKDKRETAASAEVQCQRLGDLATFAVPVDAASPGAGQWSEIEHRLDRRGLSLRRLWPALAVCAIVILCAGGWLVARRPLGYRVVDCTLAADGVFATTENREGAVAFDDGSRMSVEKDAHFHLGMVPFGHGAEISLDDGEARMSVVHRTGARWAVLAGPFRVDVTGTRFGVRWSRHLGHFQVTMLEGEVLVEGGAIPPATRLRAGQTLTADWTAATFAIANERPPSVAAPRAAVTGKPIPAELARQDSTKPHGARSPLPAVSPRKRSEAVALVENPSVASTEPAPGEPAPSVPREPTNAEPPAAPTAPQVPPPTPSTAGPTLFLPTTSPTPATVRVVLGEAGQLSNGFTGETWVASGEGTTFSAPASWDERAHLQPEAGLLCTSGTVAGLSCVNEGTPKIQCNWDRNWGVAIGWHARTDKKAWGDDATGAIAVEFRGRFASYRLNAHLKGDPSERNYCIENYKSGQVVRPSMFKSECWFDRGDTLADFARVDTFNLQFASGMSYVAFRYCISGITLSP